MAQFFNRFEAIEVRSEVEIKFPQLRVWNVMDIHNEKTGEYERSFFSVSYGESANFYINSQQQLDETLALCQYVASTIADNQQSEYVATHTCQNCHEVFESLYYGLCNDCYEGGASSTEFTPENIMAGPDLAI